MSEMLFLGTRPCSSIYLQLPLLILYNDQVVLSEADISENDDLHYNFQIWLSGSSPRHTDIRSQRRSDQCQHLLLLLRQDHTTANVELRIKKVDSTQDTVSREGSSSKIDSVQYFSALKGTVGGNVAQQEVSSRPGNLHRQQAVLTGFSETNSEKEGCLNGIDGDSYHHQPHFLAHKSILEATPFFHRMFNAGFQEGRVDPRGMYTIELSSDMFDADIMDPLLDYLYTRGSTLRENSAESAYKPTHAQHLSFDQNCHVVNANVQLNLQSVVGECDIDELGHDCLRPRSPSAESCQPFSQSAPISLKSFSRLTFANWCALYRASVPLEDKDLRSLSLERVRSLLDPSNALGQVLHWGHQHEEVKAVMVDFLIKKRREVFGNERRNQLRPYLWTEQDHQTDTLVHITSRIARQ